MLAQLISFPRGLPPGYEPLENEPRFDPSCHLGLEMPTDVWRLEDFGLSDPVQVLKGGVFYDEIPPEKRERLIALWEEIQAGM